MIFVYKVVLCKTVGLPMMYVLLLHSWIHLVNNVFYHYGRYSFPNLLIKQIPD